MQGFLGMGMAAGAGGMNPQNLFAMGQQGGGQAGQTAPSGGSTSAGWNCACGYTGNTGKFCAECGKPMPAAWDCACGHKGNIGKFCAECGKPVQNA
jgi:membrane protease subunit (stomatin/prohibitin family)